MLGEGEEEVVIFGVGGRSDTGKTDLICRMIERLKENDHKVATIKHTRGDFSIDQEGKDTWKHSEAGSEMVIFSTASETDFLLKRDFSLEKILEMISSLGSYDVVLIEGMKEEEFPKIILEEEDDSVDIDQIIGRIEREIEKMKLLQELPGLDCGRCGFDSCEGLAAAVHSGEKSIDYCEVLESEWMANVILSVDGEYIPLGKFPSNMLKKTVEGMVSSLKGVDTTEEIEKLKIEIERSAEDESDRN